MKINVINKNIQIHFGNWSLLMIDKILKEYKKGDFDQYLERPLYIMKTIQNLIEYWDWKISKILIK